MFDFNLIEFHSIQNQWAPSKLTIRLWLAKPRGLISALVVVRFNLQFHLITVVYFENFLRPFWFVILLSFINLQVANARDVNDNRQISENFRKIKTIKGFVPEIVYCWVFFGYGIAKKLALDALGSGFWHCEIRDVQDFFFFFLMDVGREIQWRFLRDTGWWYHVACVGGGAPDEWNFQWWETVSR